MIRFNVQLFKKKIMQFRTKSAVFANKIYNILPQKSNTAGYASLA